MRKVMIDRSVALQTHFLPSIASSKSSPTPAASASTATTTTSISTSFHCPTLLHFLESISHVIKFQRHFLAMRKCWWLNYSNNLMTHKPRFQPHHELRKTDPARAGFTSRVTNVSIQPRASGKTRGLVTNNRVRYNYGRLWDRP